MVVITSIISKFLFAQEFKATVNLVTTQVGTNVTKNTFQTLKTSLLNFINNRKWSSETGATKERMEGTKIGIDIAKTHRGM